MRRNRQKEARPPVRSTEAVIETITRTLNSTIDSVDSAESAAIEMARRCGLREGTILEHIGLAVHEVMTNAVVHGNRSDPEKTVVVTISRTSDELRIRISDQGEGFDPDCLHDPLSPQGLLEGSGRGIYLARRLMNEFRVQRDGMGGTTVTVVKYLNTVDAGR